MNDELRADDDVRDAPVDGRVLRTLLVKMVGMCSAASIHCSQQRASILGLASQCNDDGHSCTNGEPWIRDTYRAELMQSLAHGIVVELHRDKLSAQFVGIVYAASQLCGMHPCAGVHLFNKHLIEELRTYIEPAGREHLVEAVVRPLGARGTNFLSITLNMAAEHGQRTANFVGQLRDAVLHDFAEGGLVDPGVFSGGQEFQATFNDALMAACIDDGAARPEPTAVARKRRTLL